MPTGFKPVQLRARACSRLALGGVSERPPACFSRDFGVTAPGVAGGVWGKGETASGFADPYL